MQLSPTGRLVAQVVLFLAIAVFCLAIAAHFRRKPAAKKSTDLLPHRCVPDTCWTAQLVDHVEIVEFPTHREPRIVFEGIYCTSCEQELACLCGKTPERGSEHVSTPWLTCNLLQCCGRPKSKWRVRRQIAQRPRPKARVPSVRVASVPAAAPNTERWIN